MPRKPRPDKVPLPQVKPASTKDQIAALWQAVAALQAQVDRLTSDDDTRAAKAAQILARTP